MNRSFKKKKTRKHTSTKGKIWQKRFNWGIYTKLRKRLLIVLRGKKHPLFRTAFKNCVNGKEKKKKRFNDWTQLRLRWLKDSLIWREINRGFPRHTTEAGLHFHWQSGASSKRPSRSLMERKALLSYKSEHYNLKASLPEIFFGCQKSITVQHMHFSLGLWNNICFAIKTW